VFGVGSVSVPGRRLPLVDITLQDPLVGRVVDRRYLIESRIARGGMATVYLALDRRLDRRVALKVMHEHLADDDEFVSRFVREARAAARLSHPNVVQVFDQGADGSVLYLAMEYLPGRTLRDVLMQRGALTPRETVSVMEPVLGALAAAHRVGIVHGDVKPENVILTDDGRIKVADFGLARAVTTRISGAGGSQLLGTVAYMAPELVSRGVADAGADVRADVYAAGIMLFELLTGKQPFTGEDPAQVAYRHVREMVPAPTSIAPELPSAFDDIALRATDRDPGRRPVDAVAMLSDLLAARERAPEEQLDVRAADAATLRLDAARTQMYSPNLVNGQPQPGPAPAAAPQATRALAVPSRGVPTLLPRLRVHEDEPVERDPTAYRRTMGTAAITGAAVLVLLIFGGVWWFTGGPGAYTSTPGLVGAREGDAKRALAALGLGSTVNRVFSTKVAAGQVVSTNPAGGERVRKNGSVVLNISKGPELVPVPDLTGVSADDAESRLRSAQLALGDTTTKYSNSVDKGKIISTKPSAGSKIAPDREVDIVVSRGAEPVVLDNVVGQNVDAARQTLEGKGLKVSVNEIDWFQGAPAPGTVVQQNPPVQTAGQMIDKGSVVTLTVVKAAAGQVAVPDVRGQNFDQAKATLEGLGFQVNRKGLPFGQTVRNQDPIGQAPANSVITLSVGF
jgi:eukaryotic-like serine/threonine-protein kinase